MLLVSSPPPPWGRAHLRYPQPCKEQNGEMKAILRLQGKGTLWVSGFWCEEKYKHRDPLAMLGLVRNRGGGHLGVGHLYHHCLQKGNMHFVCRFEGISTETASNGSPALSDAIAFLECRVQSRMEVPDHWVVYAEVTRGNLSDADKKTAVHRRKMANYY